MTTMFQSASSFNGTRYSDDLCLMRATNSLISLYEGDVTTWNTSSVTSMNNMFGTYQHLRLSFAKQKDSKLTFY
jgi:hypothetical protein